MENLNILIGNNLSRMRKERDFSLDQVSQLTGVSKSMLSQIEKGKKTPTVTTLWKIASGLNVSLSLLMDDKKPSVHFVSCNNLNPLIEDDGKYKTFPFLPFNEDTKFEVFKMDLEPGCVHNSNPHTKGVKEYVFVSNGCLQIEVTDITYRACSGEALVFSGDVCHTYKNNTQEVVTTFVLIFYPNSHI